MATFCPQRFFLQFFYEKKKIVQNLERMSPFDNFALRKQMTFVSWSQHSINLFLSYMFLLNALDFFELRNT